MFDPSEVERIAAKAAIDSLLPKQRSCDVGRLPVAGNAPAQEPEKRVLEVEVAEEAGDPGLSSRLVIAVLRWASSEDRHGGKTTDREAAAGQARTFRTRHHSVAIDGGGGSQPARRWKVARDELSGVAPVAQGLRAGGNQVTPAGGPGWQSVLLAVEDRLDRTDRVARGPVQAWNFSVVSC